MFEMFRNCPEPLSLHGGKAGRDEQFDPIRTRARGEALFLLNHIVRVREFGRNGPPSLLRSNVSTLPY